MDPAEFRKWGKQMVDYVADYWENFAANRLPIPDVKPGYMKALLPAEAPEEAESYERIFDDLEPVIMQGMTHWHHPHFFAYYPTANSAPAIIGDILSDGLACVGFSWASSPACTELELHMLDWVAKMLGLPEKFLNENNGPGGGIIQATASDATFIAFLAAKLAKIKGSEIDGEKNLVAYASDQAHSSVEKAAVLSCVTYRSIPSDHEFSLNSKLLHETIEQDIKDGLTPFLVVATFGSTTCCAFDNLTSIGEICQKFELYLHVDASYAGTALVCPEFRKFMRGIEYADSFNVNAHKLMLTNFDCSLMWFSNARKAEEVFTVDPLYLKHTYQNKNMDLRHLQIPLGRRFRALKLWFVLRRFGILGIQDRVRKIHNLGKCFERHVLSDETFELVRPATIGLVCFRLKGLNEKTEQLYKKVNEDRRIHLVPTRLRETYVLRFIACSVMATEKDVDFAWGVLCELSTDL